MRLGDFGRDAQFSLTYGRMYLRLDPPKYQTVYQHHAKCKYSNEMARRAAVNSHAK